LFALSPALSGGAGLIRLEARPVRSSGDAVVSDPLQVRPGDRLDWSIPPQ
jgi:hypothetical protein